MHELNAVCVVADRGMTLLKVDGNEKRGGSGRRL